MAIYMLFQVQDSDGDTSTIEIPFSNATPMGVLTAGVAAVGALINPLVTGGLKQAGFKVLVDVPTWGPTAMLNSDVQERLEISARSAFGTDRVFNLFTVDEEIFVPGSDIADMTNDDVAAFRDFLEDGITVGGELIQPTDSRGSDLEEVNYMIESWGKRRRR